jgi:hypothetical protein
MSGAKRGSIAASVVAVLVGGTLGVVHVVGASAAGCSQNGVELNVAAAPDIAPALTTAANEWQQTDPSVDGQCIRVIVTAEPPAVTANQLVAGSGMTIGNGALPAPSASTATPPDPAVWIPDSSMWLNRVQADVSGAFVSGTSPSLVSSPVVLGVPHSKVADLKLTDGTITAEALKNALQPMRAFDNTFNQQYATPFQLGLAEPRNDAAGLAGAAALYQIDTQTQGGNHDYSLVVADYRLASPEAEAATDATSLIAAFTKKNTSFKGHTTPQMSLGFLSEQSIIAFDQTNPPDPLDVVRMDQDLAGLDYPVAVVSKSSTEIGDAALQFRKAIMKPAYAGIFAAAGFRTPDGAAVSGFPAAHGAVNTTVPVAPLHLMAGTPNDPVAGALALWAAANTKSRVLVMLNEGASMGEPSTYAGHSRMELAQSAAYGGIGLFTDDSELGSWVFAPGLAGSKDYQEVVPIKLLNQGNQAAVLGGAMQAAQSQSGRPGCSLYPTLDAAYKYMLSTYEVGKINTIVVFTDCAEAQDAKSMQLADLTTDIGGRASASTPIPVILINVNPKPDSINKNLNAIASVVGGKPLPLSTPEGIVNVFLQAIVALGPGS